MPTFREPPSTAIDRLSSFFVNLDFRERIVLTLTNSFWIGLAMMQIALIRLVGIAVVTLGHLS
jgi:hypothetical protein